MTTRIVMELEEQGGGVACKTEVSGNMMNFGETQLAIMIVSMLDMLQNDPGFMDRNRFAIMKSQARVAGAVEPQRKSPGTPDTLFGKHIKIGKDIDWKDPEENDNDEH